MSSDVHYTIPLRSCPIVSCLTNILGQLKVKDIRNALIGNFHCYSDNIMNYCTHLKNFRSLLGAAIFTSPSLETREKAAPPPSTTIST